MLFALFTRIGQTKSAVSALLAGIIAWMGGKYLFDLTTPYLASLAVSLLAYLLVAAWEHRAFKQPV